MKKNIIYLYIVCIMIIGCGKNDKIELINKELSENSSTMGIIDGIQIIETEIIKNKNYTTLNVIIENKNDYDIQCKKVSLILYDKNNEIIKIYYPYRNSSDDSVITKKIYSGLTIYLEDDIDISKIDRISIIVEKDEEEKSN